MAGDGAVGGFGRRGAADRRMIDLHGTAGLRTAWSAHTPDTEVKHGSNLIVLLSAVRCLTLRSNPSNPPPPQKKRNIYINMSNYNNANVLGCALSVHEGVYMTP